MAAAPAFLNSEMDCHSSFDSRVHTAQLELLAWECSRRSPSDGVLYARRVIRNVPVRDSRSDPVPSKERISTHRSICLHTRNSRRDPNWSMWNSPNADPRKKSVRRLYPSANWRDPHVSLRTVRLLEMARSNSRTRDNIRCGGRTVLPDGKHRLDNWGNSSRFCTVEAKKWIILSTSCETGSYMLYPLLPRLLHLPQYSSWRIHGN